MKALVTGGAGFIGSHMCEALLEKDWHVIALDNFDDAYDPKLKEQNLAQCLNHKRFELILGDIRNPQDLQRCFTDNLDLVVHLAAMVGVRSSTQYSSLYQDVNVTGTAAVLAETCRRNVEKLIFASTSSVYGNDASPPSAETDSTDYCISPYGASKKAGELLCHTYHHLYKLNVTCLRFFTVYGPRQRPDLAISQFCKTIDAGKPLTMFGDGSSMRDYIYVDDIVSGLLSAITNCQGYHIYNLGTSRPVTLSDLIMSIENVLSKKATVNRLGWQAEDAICTHADITRASQELNFTPSVGLYDGLTMFVRWLRTQSQKSQNRENWISTITPGQKDISI